MAYGLDENAVLEYYLDKAIYPISEKSIGESNAILALEEFSIDELKRVDEHTVNATGSLLTLVKMNGVHKSFETIITIPILHDENNSHVELVNWKFEKELGPFKDDSEQVSPNLTIVTGSVAEEMWETHMQIKRNVFPDDANKYPDIPERIRTDLEFIFRSYSTNKLFKARFDKLSQRFLLLSTDLVAFHPNDVQLTNYKGMPVLYLKGEQEFQAGKHRIFMTPVTCYSNSKEGFVRKFYDLRDTPNRVALERLSKLEPRFFVCPSMLTDLVTTLKNLNLQRKAPLQAQR